MLKFSANLSLLFTELDFMQRFKAARDAGFNAVEVQFPYAFSAQAIQQQVEEHRLELMLFNIDAADLLQGGEGLAAVPEKVEQFKRAVEKARDYAEILHPQVINVLPGRCLDASRAAEYLQTFQQNLSYVCNQFADMSVRIVFEAINIHDMPGFLIFTGRQMLEVLEGVQQPNLYVQYDLYHMLRMQEDCLGFLQQHWQKVGHIQFADCPGRGQPGSGAADLISVFNFIEQSGYDGWLGAEYNPQGTTVASLDWLQDFQRSLGT